MSDTSVTPEQIVELVKEGSLDEAITLLKEGRVVELGPRLWKRLHDEYLPALESMNEGILKLTDEQALDFLRQIERHPGASKETKKFAKRLLEDELLSEIRWRRTMVSNYFKALYTAMKRDKL